MSRREVPIAYRAPFAFGATPYRDARPHGETILEIVKSVPDLPPAFLKKGFVCVNGEMVPRELWAYVRPKPTTDYLPIAVTLHFPLGGGGGGGNSTKSVIGLVAAIALLVVATAITGGAAGVGAGSLFEGAFLFGAGSTSATLLAAGVGIAGALAISALTAPPTQDPGNTAGLSNAENSDPAAAQGNILNPGGAIPRVIGTRKIYPPFICEPVVELVDADEVVEALVALNGPHLLEDLRIDGVSITEAEDVRYETREGWVTDTAITLIQRQGRTLAPQITLSQYTLKSDNVNIENVELPETDLPIWHGVITRDSPDEVWIHLLFPGGLVRSTTRLRVPLRIRMRLRGSTTWINLPELHIAGDTVQQLRFAVIFKWQEVSDPISTVPADNGFVYARIDVPAQVTAPATPTDRVWTADSYFDDGAGNDYYYNGTEAASAVQNINLFKNRAEIYLKEATFPRGIYEIEIKRGYAFVDSLFNQINYNYNAALNDFFWYVSTSSPGIGQSQTNISDRVTLTRVISIWNEHPVGKDGFALIAIKATNRQIQKLSTNASGYVRDWGGSDWDTWTTTSNPAPHYVDVLSGAQNLDPLPSDLRDDAGLVAWRTLCTDNEWTCDAIIDDMRTQDVLSLIGACAYAKPYQSDQYGVTVDNDRSEDSPVQVFSRLNSVNMKFDKAFNKPPEGFIVTYRDNSSDDDRAQTIVYQRDPSIATTGLFESISYDGLIDTEKVRARALFDLDQSNLRSVFYSFDTDIESIVCRRGSLVGLQHDVLTSRSGDAHVVAVVSSGSPAMITGLTLDAEIPVTNELDMHSVTDMHGVADMHLVGVTTGVAIRRTDGTISTHLLSNATSETANVTFAVPFTDPGTIIGFSNTSYEYGCMIVSGDLQSEYKRMLVIQITPQKDLKASVVLVDEAPTLVRFGSNPLYAMGDADELFSMGETDRLISMG